MKRMFFYNKTFLVNMETITSAKTWEFELLHFLSFVKCLFYEKR